MKKSNKIKAFAYQLSFFVLGLTGGDFIPNEAHKGIALAALAILIFMASVDFGGKFLPGRKQSVKSRTSPVREKPPRKRKRKRRRK